MSLERTSWVASSSNPVPALGERVIEDSVTIKTAHSTVTLAYQANISGYWHNVTVVWSKNLMNHSLSITVDSLEGNFHYVSKIDLKPWHFWSRKGYKSFEVESNRVDVYWDLRSAKFSGSPEPCSDYYVALVSDEEVVLLLGDYKKKAYKRTKSRPALVDAFVVYKKENVFGKKSFATRARFNERAKEHDITVESAISGHREPEIWIYIDGVSVIHVKSLNWKFRGNQTITVNRQPVQVFWDVHDWLFKSPGTGHGLFIFKPGFTEPESDKDGSSNGNDSDNSIGSIYHSVRSTGITGQPDFCLFLYAWRVE
ncbi:hypothetical protein MLD38_016048 [Melastoma candidum]|uniref:Uncharacterized protein n=1 Tax=Melastoma candidum TaxID=119954 RepID=A0ACB9RMC6_9MYRT|nr:hypothetical protein MLD38_016048 [Melastoma candidum]